MTCKAISGLFSFPSISLFTFPHSTTFLLFLEFSWVFLTSSQSRHHHQLDDEVSQRRRGGRARENHKKLITLLLVGVAWLARCSLPSSCTTKTETGSGTLRSAHKRRERSEQEKNFFATVFNLSNFLRRFSLHFLLHSVSIARATAIIPSNLGWHSYA